MPIDAEVLISDLLLLQNITATESVMATLWSLPYEVQMYLALPLLYPVASERNSIYPLLGCFVVAVLMAVLLPGSQLGGWEMPRYIPCFLAGVLCYQISIGREPILPAWMWPLFVGAVTLIFLVKPGVKAGWMCCLTLGVGLPFLAVARQSG